MRKRPVFRHPGLSSLLIIAFLTSSSVRALEGVSDGAIFNGPRNASTAFDSFYNIAGRLLNKPVSEFSSSKMGIFEKLALVEKGLRERTMKPFPELLGAKGTNNPLVAKFAPPSGSSLIAPDLKNLQEVTKDKVLADIAKRLHERGVITGEPSSEDIKKLQSIISGKMTGPEQMSYSDAVASISLADLADAKFNMAHVGISEPELETLLTEAAVPLKSVDIPVGIPEVAPALLAANEFQADPNEKNFLSEANNTEVKDGSESKAPVWDPSPSSDIAAGSSSTLGSNPFVPSAPTVTDSAPAVQTPIKNSETSVASAPTVNQPAAKPPQTVSHGSSSGSPNDPSYSPPAVRQDPAPVSSVDTPAKTPAAAKDPVQQYYENQLPALAQSGQSPELQDAVNNAGPVVIPANPGGASLPSLSNAHALVGGIVQNVAGPLVGGTGPGNSSSPKLDFCSKPDKTTGAAFKKIFITDASQALLAKNKAERISSYQDSLEKRILVEKDPTEKAGLEGALATLKGDGMNKVCDPNVSADEIPFLSAFNHTQREIAKNEYCQTLLAYTKIVTHSDANKIAKAGQLGINYRENTIYRAILTAHTQPKCALDAATFVFDIEKNLRVAAKNCGLVLATTMDNNDPDLFTTEDSLAKNEREFGVLAKKFYGYSKDNKVVDGKYGEELKRTSSAPGKNIALNPDWIQDKDWRKSFGVSDVSTCDQVKALYSYSLSLMLSPEFPMRDVYRIETSVGGKVLPKDEQALPGSSHHGTN